jgi:hypothetical protein
MPAETQHAGHLFLPQQVDGFKNVHSLGI